MSTVTEIEEAIERLPAADREALENRLITRRFGLDALDDQQRADLLASLVLCNSYIFTIRRFSCMLSGCGIKPSVCR